MTSGTGDAVAARTMSVLGVPITPCTLEEAVRLIEDMIQKGGPHLVALVNAHTLNLAHENHEYREVLRGASLVLRDGVGVRWALKRKGALPLHNFVGTDFLPDFCRCTANRGYRLFLLGSKPGVAQSAAENLKSMSGGIVIAGHHHGYFPRQQDDRIISHINAMEPDVLLVAMGNPQQELWIAHNLSRLKAPVCIGVGALFDYLSSQLPRAPQWMRKANMEWVFRLAAEPGRLWKRYLIGNGKFILRVRRECAEDLLNDGGVTT